jgi:hypothetical protein
MLATEEQPVTDFAAFVDTYNRANFQLLGEIITWDLSSDTAVKFADLVTALQDSGLETKVARELLPRYAFVRAAKKMAEQRIIRCVGEANGRLAFQFTKEHLDSTAGRFDYDYEATILLDKDNGSIEVVSTTLNDAECQKLAEHARDLLQTAMENRTTADITRVIKRLFEKRADLFPVREAGSVYFVPDKHAAFVDSVETFVTRLSGRLNRFPVPEGTQKGNKSVQAAVTQGLQQVINEHAAAVAEFGTDTRISTINKAIEKVETTGFKIEAYAQYLDTEKQKLVDTLGLIRAQMKQKLEEVLSLKEEK